MKTFTKKNENVFYLTRVDRTNTKCGQDKQLPIKYIM